MRKALIVGIDYYEAISSLSGCVNDAKSVATILERNFDGTVNFKNPNLILSTNSESSVSKKVLKNSIRNLFMSESEIALFYFAGHGYIEDTGGFLCASESTTGDDGLSLNELMAIVNSSPAKNKIIILDSCHSGIVGNRVESDNLAEIKDGVTILTASTENGFAEEVPGGGAGVFTKLLVSALNGAAANLVGEITPGSVYAHIDQSLGPWSQRPIFKTNVQTFVSLRKSKPPILLSDLQALTTYFPKEGFEFNLDPSYEPERSDEQDRDSSIPKPDLKKNAIFATLQKYVKVNLVRPKGAPHMWHAAMQSKSCELTLLGEHYRQLLEKKLI